MESIIPFLKVLPEFVKVSETEDIYTIRGEILPHHRDRFDMYCRKVRYLYPQSFKELVRGHAIAVLQSMSSGQGLFPGLKMIYVPAFEVIGYNKTLEFLNILFLSQSSSLLTVSLGGINSVSDEFAASYLCVLSKKASSLQELILAGRLSPISLNLVSNFSKLRVLTISGQQSTLQTSFLERCSSLDNLTHLSVNLDNSSTVSINSITPQPGGFAALQALQLGGAPAEISKLLQSISPSSLKSITISCSLSWRDYQPESFALCIKECGRISPSYRITLRFGQNGRSVATISQSDSLLSLQSCKSLKILEIVGITLHITDDTIRHLCKDAWRSLQFLHLPPTEFDHSPSLLILKVFAQSCPDLQSLLISINFRNTPELDFSALSKARASRIPHNLRSLRMSKVPGQDGRIAAETNTVTMAISVSLFVEHLFPNLKESKLVSDFQGDMDWWKTVKNMMKAYKMVREETASEMQASTACKIEE